MDCHSCQWYCIPVHYFTLHRQAPDGLSVTNLNNEPTSRPFLWWMVPVRFTQVLFFPIGLLGLSSLVVLWFLLHPLVWGSSIIWGWLGYGDPLLFFRLPGTYHQCLCVKDDRARSPCGWYTMVEDGSEMCLKEHLSTHRTEEYRNPSSNIRDKFNTFPLPGLDIPKTIWDWWWWKPKERPFLSKPTVF